MRNFLYSIVFICVFLTQALAQENLFQAKPFSFTFPIADKAQEVVLPTPDYQSVINQADKEGISYKIGVTIPVSLNIFNSGTWTKFPDGTRVWRLQITSPEAKALSVYYSAFYLPEGSRLFIYNAAKTHVTQSYGFENNPASGLFATPVTVGNSTILEYFEPAGVKGTPIIDIDKVGFICRAEHTFGPRNASDNGASDASCEVNVNCSEGANFQNQKRAVVKLYITEAGQLGICSGSILNNTNQDCTQYLLTAQHCGGAINASDLAQMIVYFNFESSNCSNVTNSVANTLDNQTLTGVTRVASSGTITDVQKSDFLLLKITPAIPASYNVYYLGWNKASTAPSSGVGIHHPAGDIKKISTYTSTPTSSSWSGTPANTHWQLSWAATTNGHGVTEGGSSGSPLFDSNGRVVGDLSGGSSYCTAPNAPDLYGKFVYSWDQCGTANTSRLKPWLDPAGTNPTTLDGKNACNVTPPPTGGCDTSGNYSLASSTPTIYSVQGGYISGNNSYGDLSKADIFYDVYPTGTTVKGAYFYFGRKSGTGNVTLKVWTNSSTCGTPGTTAVRTQTVSIPSIPTNGSPVFFDFSSNPLTITGDIFIGLDLPTATGDTVALITNAQNELTPGTAWEKWSDGTWHAYSDSTGWNTNLAHAIIPIFCPPSGTPVVANFSASQTTAITNTTVVTMTQQCTNSPTSYSWSFSPSTVTYSGGTSAASANPQVTFTAAGLYTVTLTASKTGSSDTRVRSCYILVKDKTNTGIENQEIILNGIYPNPSSGVFTVDLGGTIPKNGRLIIRDMTGKLLMEQTLLQSGSNQIILDLSAYANGIYILEAGNESSRIIRKVVLSK
jgi:PKD repeat protein